MQPTQSKLSVRLCLAVLSCMILLALQGIPLAAQDSPAAQTTDQNPAVSEPNTSDSSESPVPSTGTASSGLHLGPGDLVEMSAYNVPELNTKARVTGKGDIYFPFIGYTHVAGLTTEEAQTLIEKRLGEYLKNPQVSLFVAEYTSEGASVLGEVNKPGVYPVLGQQHLFDLISAAGGTSEKAGHSITVTHRSAPDQPITVPLTRNLTDQPESNVAVFPGDTVIVHKADVVYVVGDVGRPSALLMDTGNLTVLKAIALAGGTNRTAKLGGAKILRKTANGMEETPIQLKKILAAKAPDPVLVADDILVVPSSFGKILAGRSLEAAMQSATMVSVLAVP
ncbi:MAG: polysaccharide biosynthesis/export family protein [Terriglobales bacterium]